MLASRDTSKVSQLCELWRMDVLQLADEDWEEGIQQYLPLAISARDRFIQLKFLHCAYYSPTRLARIYPDRMARCPRCSSDSADFFHVVWSCPGVVEFWKNILTDINSIGKMKVPYSPIPLLLGICDFLEVSWGKKLFIFYTTLYARKAILLQWNHSQPPTRQLWQSLVNKALPLYKMMYMGRNCPKKFGKIWAAWVKAKHLTID